MKRTTAPQQGEVTSLTTLLREGMSRTMKQPGLVPGESNWPETDTGIRIGEGSPRVVETTGTGRVGGSEEGKFMVSPGLDVGVHSQGEDRDRGLTISDPSGNTESRVQAASERKGGPDDHRERDPGGIVASPLARGPDSLPCASVTGDAGRGVEEFQVQSGAQRRQAATILQGLVDKPLSLSFPASLLFLRAHASPLKKCFCKPSCALMLDCRANCTDDSSTTDSAKQSHQHEAKD